MQQLIDPYRALGVAHGATDAEIKAAHRKLVKRYHPDAGNQSETDRFLRVQEAYRVLSDPLLRKEWDLKHAPGPIRADRPATPTRRRQRPAPHPEAEPAESHTRPPRSTGTTSGGQAYADPRTRPRSSRAYTWSASEVPWWEESRTTADKQKSGKQRRPKSGSKAAPPPPPPDGPAFNPQDFDVYNRSSGAAWSSAARAYFRKGEADLPRRGSFRQQGTQVVTAGRARMAAEAEARRRAAAAAAAAAEMDDVFATPQTMSHAAPGPHEGTTHIVRRALPAPWPNVPQRLAYALVAWVPMAAVIAAGFANGTQLALASALMAASLVLLVVLPRIAYIGAVATVLVLVIGGLFIGGALFAGASPSLERLAFYVGVLLLVGYVGTAAAVVLGPSTLRPWSAQ
ncbi:MAG TPA: J domain-containing protein [Candidatus Limnocylindrales bacterium]